MMIDRVSVAGMSGTLATFGLSTIDTFLGIAVGAVTLVYMSIKLYQEIKKKWSIEQQADLMINIDQTVIWFYKNECKT